MRRETTIFLCLLRKPDRTFTNLTTSLAKKVGRAFASHIYCAYFFPTYPGVINFRCRVQLPTTYLTKHCIYSFEAIKPSANFMELRNVNRRIPRISISEIIGQVWRTLIERRKNDLNNLSVSFRF